jgi:hypothetical protein
MMGSSVAGAVKPPPKAQTEVGILNRNYSNPQMAEEEQIRVVFDELGISYAVENLNGSEDPKDITRATKRLLVKGIKGLILLTTSSQGLYASNTVNDWSRSPQKSVLLMPMNATSIANTNSTGGYFIRPNVSGFAWGYKAAQQAFSDLSSVSFTDYAFIRRAATANSGDLFGYWCEQGFQAYLADNSLPPALTIVMDNPGNTFTPDLSALDSGTWLVGTALRRTANGSSDCNCNQVVEAIRLHSNEPNLYLTTTGTVDLEFSGSDVYYEPDNWDYTQTSGHVIGVVPGYSKSDPGYLSWRNWWGEDETDHYTLRCFDMAVIMAAGLFNWNGVSMANMRSKIISFCNPPGDELLPGYFDQLPALVGQSLDYYGASGDLTLVVSGTDQGELAEPVYEQWAPA